MKKQKQINPMIKIIPTIPTAVLIPIVVVVTILGTTMGTKGTPEKMPQSSMMTNIRENLMVMMI